MSSEPRRRMDREQVLESAEAIVDRDGWPELTMSALARELGLAVPSLYRHVRNLEALRGRAPVPDAAALGHRPRAQGHGPVG